MAELRGILSLVNKRTPQICKQKIASVHSLICTQSCQVYK